MKESHPLTRLLTKMSKKWPCTSKMYDSCLQVQRTSWNSSFLCVLLGLRTYCWEPNLNCTYLICAVHVKHMWFILACETLWKKKPAFRCQTSLKIFLWKFLWIYGEQFLLACTAVMQCFLQTLECFCSTMLKWHVHACTCMNS